MPLFHCQDCHHEWEGTEDMNTCDWCEGEGHVIQDVTGIEATVRAFLSPELTVLRALAAANKED